MDINLFQTTIGKYQNTEIVKQHLPILDEYLNRTNTLMYGIDNHKTTFHTELDEEFNSDKRLFELFDWCVDTTLKHFYDAGFDVQKLQQRPYFFVSEITKGGYFDKHTHPNCNFSGVFYLNAVANETSELTVHDPRPHSKILVLPRWKDESYFHHTFNPETGDLFIWESWLEHSVGISKSTSSRKTLVFNI